jgi:hypothetical protein
MDMADHKHLAMTWSGESNTPANWIDKVRSRDFLELTVVFTLVMVALWTPNPVRSLAGWVALVLIVLTSLRSGEHTAALGMRLAGFRQSLWVTCVALAGAAIAVLIGWRMHTLHPVLRGLPAWWGFWAYMFWALLQQFILQDFFLLRLLRLLPSKTTAIAAAALLFAVVHIPNSLLMFLTLLWGAAACVLFLRYRNLYTLGLAHGLLGLCLAIAVPNPIHHQMRVGLGYFRWHSPGTSSSQPDQPYRVDRSVGNGGGK